MIKDIRLLSQQLVNPTFNTPKELVSWMGAMQAQQYAMCKWAVGIRLKAATIKAVDESLQKGEILRTHVMRPTWHLVTAEDIRWMIKLSAKRLRSCCASRDKELGIDESLYTKSHNLVEKMLEGNKSLTRDEIGLKLTEAGIEINTGRITHFMMRAETEGIVCSGVDKGNKQTYALLEERVPPTKELHREEALEKLATNYFRSHSPASLQDFVWWSGLNLTEARQAIESIESDLIRDRVGSENLFVHQMWNKKIKTNDVFHFLPAFDEYLISYKDRTGVLDLEHYPKAFNNYGTFSPVILHNGQIVGNWNKTVRKSETIIETSLFVEDLTISDKLIQLAEDRYKSFIS
jgi:hypothetical protein